MKCAVLSKRLCVTDRLSDSPLRGGPTHDGPLEFVDFAFHGIALRGNAFSRFALKSYLDAAGEPLELIRSGTCIPEVFYVSALIISKEIAESIQDVTNILMMPTRYKQLVQLDLDWASSDEGRRWWRENEDRAMLVGQEVGLTHPFVFLDDDPALHLTAPERFELVMPRYERAVAPLFKGQTRRRRYRTHYNDSRSIHLCDDMLQQFPIFRRGDIFISEKVFTQFEHAIDTRFFHVQWLTT
jgi:hypothetical protein